MKKPKQEAKIPTSVIPAVTIPETATPITLPVHRQNAFRTAVAARLREGAAKGERAVIVCIANEQVAFAKVLSDHDFEHKVASAYIAEMAALHQTVSMDEAHREIRSIFTNRIEDTKQFVKLLAQPEFVAAVRAEAAQLAPAPVKGCPLPEVKKAEIVRRLVQGNDVDGAEPAVHVAASARGQQITHQALANLFKPEGPLRAELVNSLSKVMPQTKCEDVQKLAATWLTARHNPAHAVANALKEGGELYVAAMKQAEALQQQKLGITTPAPISTPKTTTNAPRAYAGPVHHADLMMDAI